jgi:hypothetical protein
MHTMVLTCVDGWEGHYGACELSVDRDMQLSVGAPATQVFV